MFWRFINIVGIKRVSGVVLALSLAACSGGDGGLLAVTVDDSGNTVLAALGVTWTVPSVREDGITPLPIGEVAGFRIYYGTTAGDYRQQVNVTNSVGNVQVEDIPAGTYYVVVTVVDTDGRESVYSNEVVVVI